MKKPRKRRISFVQFFLAITAVFTIGGFALINTVNNVFAASVSGFSVEGLTANYTNGSWTASTANSLDGSATGSDGDQCSSASSTTSTMTLTCNKNNATLSFSYAKPTIASGGSVRIDGTSVTAAGTFEKEMNSGDSIQIVIVSGSAGKKTSSVKITNINLVSVATITATFLAPDPVEAGTYTINGTDYTQFTSPYTYRTDNTSIVVKALPNSDYSFFGWFDNTGNLYSTDTQTEILKDTSYSIYPYFYKKTEGMFYVSGVYKNTFASALSYAVSANKKTIELACPNGHITAGEYTIQSGYTLLVPFDNNHTIYTTGPSIEADSARSCFRKLIIDPDVTINVSGSISVSAKMSSTMGRNGIPTGKYGGIQFASATSGHNSQIIVKNGGNIYCWGYIWGNSGLIEIENGGKVYEGFQMIGWRGGTATCGDAINAALGNLNEVLTNNKIFPFNQYTIQNIETPLKINYGATETVFSCANVAKQDVTASIAFIGPSGMFRLSEGAYIIKSYDYSKDELSVDVFGSISVANITTKINTINLDSKNFILPINSNMCIHLNPGATILTSQSLNLHPSSKIIIDEGAELQVTSGKEIFVYDSDDWGNYAGDSKAYMPTIYSPSGTIAAKTLVDAEIDINGTISVSNGGGLYTTTHGANIHTSLHTGKIVFFEGVGQTTVVHQATQSGTTLSNVNISVTNAKLRNGPSHYNTSNEYFLTDQIEAGKDILFDSSNDEWSTSVHIASKYTYTFEDTVTNNSFDIEYTEGEEYTFPTNVDAVSHGFDSTNSLKYWFTDIADFTPGSLYESGDLPQSNMTFRAFYGGWTKDSNSTNGKYVDYMTGEYLIGLQYIENVNGTDHKIHWFDYNGLWTINSDGLFNYENGNINEQKYPNGDNQLYLISGGFVDENHGLYYDGMGSYYYFGEANYAYKGGTYYISKTNGLKHDDIDIPEGFYYFDENGVMDIDHTHSGTKAKPTSISGGVAYVTYNTEVADNYGLFAYGNNLYYAGVSGVLVTSTSFYVSIDMINGCTIGETSVTAGLYYFDQQGRMYDSELNLITTGGQTI